MTRNKVIKSVLILLVIAILLPSITSAFTPGIGLNRDSIYSRPSSEEGGVGLRLDVIKPLYRPPESMGLLTKNDDGKLEVKSMDLGEAFREYYSKPENFVAPKSKGRLFWESMTDPADFDRYYGDLKTSIGTALNFMDMAADVSKLFGWENEAHIAYMDKVFSTKLGKVFDADNWESNLCMAMGNGGESRTVIVSSSSSGTSYQGMSGAYIRAQKSTAFEVPNGTSYKYYFVDWYIASLKKEGLKVDVKLYKSNGHSESMLEEVKILGAASPWKSGVQMIQSDQNYVKVCLEFLSPSLGDYFEFYSLDNNRICQKINSVD